MVYSCAESISAFFARRMGEGGATKAKAYMDESTGRIKEEEAAEMSAY